jgi:CRISPR system Cascade subunit CasE
VIYEVRLQLNPQSRDARRVMANHYQMHQRLRYISPEENRDLSERQGRVLWRYVDQGVIVRSTVPLDWQKFDQRYPDFGSRHHLTLKPNFQVGERFLFNCLAYARGTNVDGNDIPKRAETYIDWLCDHTKGNGFGVDEVRVVCQEPYPIKMSKGPIKLLPVELLGVLCVKNGKAFQSVFENGLGRMRGYGCGMILLKQLDEDDKNVE